MFWAGKNKKGKNWDSSTLTTKLDKKSWELEKQDVVETQVGLGPSTKPACFLLLGTQL